MTPITTHQHVVTHHDDVVTHHRTAAMRHRVGSTPHRVDITRHGAHDHAMSRVVVTRHRLAAASVAATLLIGASLAGCSPGRASAATSAATADAKDPVAVVSAPVAMADVASPIDLGGVVQARTTATITARVLAPVREVRVSPGDRVRKGQTLIVLDGDDLAAGARAARAAALAAEQGSKAAAAELQAADASLALARATHDRIAGLLASRSATAQELDDATAARRSAEAHVAALSARTLQARSAVESARAASDQASTTESFTTIAAPFDGMVSAKMVDPGNMASPGMPLLRLEDTRGFRLEVRADESRIGLIRIGDTVPVFLGAAAGAGADATSIEGTVVEISRAVDADARAFLVKIALPDTPGKPDMPDMPDAPGTRDLRSGAFAKARFAGTPRRALTVPMAAIVRRGQLTSVFVIDRGVARTRLVSLRESEVLAGLTESDVVILSPPAGVIDGRRVSVGGR